MLEFSSDVTMIQIAIFPPPPIDPNAELTLPVAGDSFGTGANMVMGPGATQVTVTLGADPVLRLSGTFGAANVATGSPSGIDVAATTAISTVASGNPAAAGAIDLESTLTPGFVAGPSLITARGYHTATVLDDGRVLVVGGLNDGSTFAYENEVLDAGVFTDAADPSLGGNGGIMAAMDPAGQPYFIGRYDHTATKLPSGQVLIAGGRGFEALFDANGAPVVQELYSAFLFDPTTNQFNPTAGMIDFPAAAPTRRSCPTGRS